MFFIKTTFFILKLSYLKNIYIYNTKIIPSPLAATAVATKIFTVFVLKSRKAFSLSGCSRAP